MFCSHLVYNNHADKYQMSRQNLIILWLQITQIQFSTKNYNFMSEFQTMTHGEDEYVSQLHHMLAN